MEVESIKKVRLHTQSKKGAAKRLNVEDHLPQHLGQDPRAAARRDRYAELHRSSLSGTVVDTLRPTSQELLDPGQRLTPNAIVLTFVYEMAMGNFAKGLGKVHQNQVIDKGEELCFTGSALSETVLHFRQDVIAIQVAHHGTSSNVFYEFAVD
ncbi:hypothetical protein Bbelb_000210 [Branchiostoma belcheri]|nr:hypothetical protein Bbelb_000210 [Branchiostoma belcheri]